MLSSQARAHWKQLQNLFSVKEHGKMLGESYWEEFAFSGSLEIGRWLSNIGRFHLDSYAEALESMKKLEGIGNYNTFYAKKKDQEDFQVCFDQNKLLVYKNKEQEPINTWVKNKDDETIRITGIEAHTTLYVFKNNTLYLLDKVFADKHRNTAFYHSSLAAGSRTECAGKITVVDGKIKLISNDSGHYRPEPPRLAKLIRFLKESGADLTDTKISIVGDKKYDVSEFLEKHPLVAEQKNIFRHK